MRLLLWPLMQSSSVCDDACMDGYEHEFGVFCNGFLCVRDTSTKKSPLARALSTRGRGLVHWEEDELASVV
jgi:hypothetical protein